MSKKNTKFKLFIIFILSFVLILNHSFATTTANVMAAPPDFADVGGIITNFNKNIVQNLVVLLSGAALAIFLWGLVRFIYDRSRGNEKDLARDKKGMMWGLGAMFILVTLWGIIRLVQGILGVQGDNNINLPRICTNGSCDTVRSATPAQNGVGGGGTFNEGPRGIVIIPEDESVNIPEGEDCMAGGVTTGFICAAGLSCRGLSGEVLQDGAAGKCQAIGLQKGDRCLASMTSESNMCGQGLDCKDASGNLLRGSQYGTCQ